MAYKECSSKCPKKGCNKICYRTGDHSHHKCLDRHVWPEEWWEK